MILALMSQSIGHTDSRILVLTGWYPSSLEPSNGDFVKEQVRLLRLEGLKIDLIYADLNIAYLPKGVAQTRTELSYDDQGNLTAILSGPFWPKNTLWGLNRWIVRYASFIQHIIASYRQGEKYRLIHTHTYLGGCVALRVDTPYLITEHFTGWLDGSIRKSHRSLAIPAMDQASVVTAVSPGLTEAMSKVTDTKTITLPNFIDTTFFIPSAKEPSDVFGFIGVGDLIKRKNWGDLIKAFAEVHKELPDTSLTIIGEGEERDGLRELISKLHLEKSIQLTGRLGRDQLLQHLQKAHVLVHPSLTETFGLVLAEAMSCGLPVITYPNEAASHLIRDSDHGMITSSFSSDLLASAMTKMIEEYDRFERSSLHRYIQNNFSPQSITEQLKAIYSEVEPE